MYCKSFFFLFCVFSLAACGGGGSGGSKDPVLRIESPAQNEDFAAGDTVTMRIAVENFQFEPPINARLSSLSKEDGAEDSTHGDAESQESETSSHDSHESSQDAVDAHHGSDSEGSFSSNRGHYHVYLDACEGDHITAWHVSEDNGTTQVSIVDFELPADLASGSHYLCVDLRNSGHQQLGIIRTVDINVS